MIQVNRFSFVVRIRGCGLAKFKGFMIQPRSAVYPDRPAFLGAFLRVRGTRYECVRTGVSCQIIDTLRTTVQGNLAIAIRK